MGIFYADRSLRVLCDDANLRNRSVWVLRVRVESKSDKVGIDDTLEDWKLGGKTLEYGNSEDENSENEMWEGENSENDNLEPGQVFSGLDDYNSEYLYVSGVCVSKKGLILTSSQICEFSNKVLQGHSFGNSRYITMKVIYVDKICGWALVTPKKRLVGKSFKKSSLSDEFIRPGRLVRVVGHPWAMKFFVLRGRLTSECTFDPRHLDISRAPTCQNSYLNVNDVMQSDSTLILAKDIGLNLELDRSKKCPLLTIEGFYHRNGLSGSPIFDHTGLVNGLIWFGDTSYIYGIPSQIIVYRLKKMRTAKILKRRKIRRKIFGWLFPKRKLKRTRKK